MLTMLLNLQWYAGPKTFTTQSESSEKNVNK